MKKWKGFTLIELLVVVAIIAVLVAILLPALAKARASAKAMVCMANFHSLGMGIQQYAMDNNDTMWKSYTGGNPWPDWWPMAMAVKKYLPNPDNFGLNHDSTRAVWNCPVVAERATGAGTAFVQWTCLRISNWNFWTSYGTADWVKMSRIENPSRQVFLIDGSMTDATDIFRGYVGSGTGGWTRFPPPDSSPGYQFDVNGVGTTQPGFVHNGKADALFADMHIQLLAPQQITREMFENPDP